MYEAKAIGLSAPSGVLCDITAPKPYAEALASNLIGRVGSENVRTFGEAICFLAFQNAFSHIVDQLHLVSACNNASSSCSRVDRLGMNFPL